MGEIRAVSAREGKLIRSLSVKKYRDETGLFVAEGRKVIEPMLPFFDLQLLISSSPWSQIDPEKQRTATGLELKKLSALTTPASEIALFRVPSSDTLLSKNDHLIVALDAVQNPGNLGTIIRLCDWLGIRSLILGEGTADPFSPKVVQATAGALGNVNLFKSDGLTDFIRKQAFDQVLGTSLDGLPVGQMSDLSGKGRTLVLFGNEGHGLSPELKALCTSLILIPSAGTTVSESLNVSISAAILLSRLSGL